MEENLTFEQIAQTLQTVNSKNKVMQLDECIDFELRELAQRVYQYRKGAELNITLKFNPDSRNELQVLAEVKTKIPKGKVKENLLYIDSKGNLFQEDPDQLKLLDKKQVDSINARK